MFEPTTTMTAVKTKTVTRTQMAVALACLGASIIAAAAMSIAGVPSSICISNAKINVALTLGQGTLINSCKGQLIVPTPKFSQLLVRNYNDEVLTLLVDKKYVTFKVGEDYKPVGKPIGDALLYQQNLYVAYSGKVDKKADINLFYGYPTGEKGVFCSDNDESQKNFDGSSIKDFKFVNPYIKGTASYYDEDTDEMIPVEDSCITYDYGYYGAEAAAITNNLQEGYCSTADGGKWFSKVITCEGGCVDGACLSVAASSTPPAPGEADCVDVVDGGNPMMVNDKSSSKVWWVYENVRHEIPNMKTLTWWFHKEDGSTNFSVIQKVPPAMLYQYTEGKLVCDKSAEQPVTPSSTLVCSDSDNGIDYYTKGHLVGEMFQGVGQATYHLDSNDACTDATRLSEYYCYVGGESKYLQGGTSAAIPGEIKGTSYGAWLTYDCAKEGAVCTGGICTIKSFPTSTVLYISGYTIGDKIMNGTNKLNGYLDVYSTKEEVKLKSITLNIDVYGNSSVVGTTTISNIIAKDKSSSSTIGYSTDVIAPFVIDKETSHSDHQVTISFVDSQIVSPQKTLSVVFFADINWSGVYSPTQVATKMKKNTDLVGVGLTSGKIIYKAEGGMGYGGWSVGDISSF